eukprot:6476319-Amphidinium_carterae.1
MRVKQIARLEREVSSKSMSSVVAERLEPLVQAQPLYTFVAIRTFCYSRETVVEDCQSFLI